jgi:hypothetical protein
MHIFEHKEKNCNEELIDLYSSLNIDRVINSRRMRGFEKNEMGGACSTYGEERRIQGFGGEI